MDFFDESFNNDLWSYDVFIMGVPEGRLSLGNESCDLAPDEILNHSLIFITTKKDIDIGMVTVLTLKLNQSKTQNYSKQLLN